MGNCLLLVSFAAARAGVTQGPPPPPILKRGVADLVGACVTSARTTAKETSGRRFRRAVSIKSSVFERSRTISRIVLRGNSASELKQRRRRRKRENTKIQRV